VVFEDFEKHLGETIGGVGGKAFGIGEMTDRIKGPEDIRGAVNQIKARTVRHNWAKHQIPNKSQSPKFKTLLTFPLSPMGKGWGEGDHLEIGAWIPPCLDLRIFF
jgi:hypothetical protein